MVYSFLEVTSNEPTLTLVFGLPQFQFRGLNWKYILINQNIVVEAEGLRMVVLLPTYWVKRTSKTTNPQLRFCQP